MTVVVVHIQIQGGEPELFGVFESKEKYMEEIKPHLELKGVKGPFYWQTIKYRSALLMAQEVELNQFQDRL